MDCGAFIDRSRSSATTLIDLLEQYEKEIMPTKRGAAQEISRIAVLNRSTFVKSISSTLY